MQRSRRALVVLLVPLIVLLSSCARVQSALTIKDEKTITMHVNYGMQANVAYNAKITPEQACGLITPGENGVPKDAKTKSYNETDYIGCEVDFTTTMEQLNSGAKDPVLEHRDGKWTFHWSADQAKQLVGGQGESADPAQISDFKIDVTFPGAVTSHNGSSTVKGNTVTWTDPKDFFSADGLKAESGGSGTAVVGGKSFPLVPVAIGGGVLLLVLAGLIAWLVSRNRKRQRGAAVTPPPADHDGQTVYEPRPGSGPYPPDGTR